MWKRRDRQAWNRMGVAALVGAALGFAPHSHALSSYLSLEGAATTLDQASVETTARWSFAPRLPFFAKGRIWVDHAPNSLPRTADREILEAGGAWSRFTLLGRMESLTASTPLFRGDAIARYRSNGVELRFHFFDRDSLDLPEPEGRDLDLQLPTLGARIEWVTLSSNQESTLAYYDSLNRFTQFALIRAGGNVLLIPKIDFHTTDFRPEIASGSISAYSSPHLRLIRIGPDEATSSITGLFTSSQQLYSKWRASGEYVPFLALTHAGLTAPDRTAWSMFGGVTLRDARLPAFFWSPSIEVIHQQGQLNGQFLVQVRYELGNTAKSTPPVSQDTLGKTLISE